MEPDGIRNAWTVVRIPLDRPGSQHTMIEPEPQTHQQQLIFHHHRLKAYLAGLIANITG